MEISQEQLYQIIDKAVRTILDNGISCSADTESEDSMSVNHNKIRRYIILHGEKVWITANTEQEYAEKILALVGSSTSASPVEKHNFYDYAEHWFNTFSKPNISKVTALTYSQQLRTHIYPALKDKNLEDITTADIQIIFNDMHCQATQESKNKVKNILNQIFNAAVEDKYILCNPIHSKTLKIKGKQSTQTEPYTVEQMKFLATHLSDIRNITDRAWLAISITLPLRPEEVLGLRWEDVDTEKCILHIRNTVTHPDRNRPEFKTYTKTASSQRDLVFPKTILTYLPPKGAPDEFIVGGKAPLSYTMVRKMRLRIAKDIHFDTDIVPRRFRTTVATDISAMTHDLKLVQNMLGHSTPQMTLKHYDKGRNKSVDAAEAIEQCYQIV